MQISILTSAHTHNDDRIFFHLAKELLVAGHRVEVVSSKYELEAVQEGIFINCFDGIDLPKKKKVEKFVYLLKKSSPDLILCCEPLPILAAHRIKSASNKKVSILSDITEWYPSKRQLLDNSKVKNSFRFLKLVLFNLYASSLVDGFIFGEWYKSRPYRLLFPFKPFTYVTYYPNLNYISATPIRFNQNEITLCHSGKISRENGYINFVEVVNHLSGLLPEYRIKVKVIGWYETEEDKEECSSHTFLSNERIEVEMSSKLPYEEYIRVIQSVDVFLDLRATDFENQRSLPIKLFYYLALGRPVIFSDLKSIRKEVAIEKFGYLVDPGAHGKIASLLANYCKNPALYRLQAENALEYSNSLYNWKKISPGFVNFIQSFTSDKQ